MIRQIVLTRSSKFPGLQYVGSDGMHCTAVVAAALVADRMARFAEGQGPEVAA